MGEGVALEDRRAVRAEALEVRLELRPVARRQRALLYLDSREREVVETDEVFALVAPRRRDQAGAHVGARLDVALPGPQQARSQIDEREVVLLGEIGHAGDDVVEALSARVCGLGEGLEELGQLAGEAVGVHAHILCERSPREGTGAPLTKR